jgi:hypothetical protein
MRKYLHLVTLSATLMLCVSFALVSKIAAAAPYGLAGCGLGALAVKDQHGKIQIIAATVNNLISPQTFAITSGTSNCYDDATTASARFIEINKVALMKDVARGKGESLTSLSAMLKCSDPDQLGTSLQRNYSAIFPNNSVSGWEIQSSIEATVRQDKQLAHACKALI